MGVPILSRDGAIDGALCVFDTEPLTLDARAIDALSDAAERLAVELHAGYERVQTHERFTALSRLALTDQVTSLANRRGGEEAFAREVSRARRSGAPLSLVLFDIDHFKQINDRAGHAVGDRVLRGISDILSASQRGSDLAMRWGGEEFLVLLPDVGLAGARAFAERMRENVQNLAVAEAGRITVSAGVAELQHDEDAASALARADASLYRAKAAGRNRVECDDPRSYSPGRCRRPANEPLSTVIGGHDRRVRDVHGRHHHHRLHRVAAPQLLRQDDRARRGRRLHRDERGRIPPEWRHDRIRLAPTVVERAHRGVRIERLQRAERHVEGQQQRRPRRRDRSHDPMRQRRGRNPGRRVGCVVSRRRRLEIDRNDRTRKRAPGAAVASLRVCALDGEWKKQQRGERLDDEHTNSGPRTTGHQNLPDRTSGWGASLS